jgi:O-antigen/teichoic acid export membrane protein
MAKYWFRQKTFGYGATPNTWQGWVLTIVSCAAVFGVILFGPAIRDNVLRAVWMVLGCAAVLVPTVSVMRAKTEGGWRWRNGRGD